MVSYYSIFLGNAVVPDNHRIGNMLMHLSCEKAKPLLERPNTAYLCLNVDEISIKSAFLCNCHQKQSKLLRGQSLIRIDRVLNDECSQTFCACYVASSPPMQRWNGDIVMSKVIEYF